MLRFRYCCQICFDTTIVRIFYALFAELDILIGKSRRDESKQLRYGNVYHRHHHQIIIIIIITIVSILIIIIIDQHLHSSFSQFEFLTSASPIAPALGIKTFFVKSKVRHGHFARVMLNDMNKICLIFCLFFLISNLQCR